MTDDNAKPGPPSGRISFPAPLTTVIAFAAALAFIYGIKDFRHTEAAAAPKTCPITQALIAHLKPFVRGDVAALALADPALPMPQLSFAGPNGQTVTLADFRGRNILLNLWANWCVPCRREIPALDRLEAERGGPNFQVVAINVDTAQTARPQAFLHEIGVKNLTFYADPKADVFDTLRQDGKVVGLPTTILVGKDGCAIGSLAGPAQWDSGDALALITAETK